MRKHLRAAWEFIVALVTRFREERVTQTAGSLTYTTLLSLVPLFTVALAVSTAFPAFDEWISSLQLFILENVLPDTPAVNTLIEQINTFSENAARLTAIGIAGFVVTSVMLMLTIDNALNRIFRVQRRRSIVQNVFVYWGVITLGPLFVGGSLSSTYFALRQAAGRLTFTFLADALVGVVPFMLTCGALMLLYSVVPARRVEWRHAVLGGLLAGVGFEIAKRGFAIYLSRVPTYTLIYGAFATIPIFLIWLYLSWLVVLTGAIFTAMLPVFGRKPERHRVPGEELADALGVLGALARAHERGDVLPLNALARAQRLPPDRCEEILVRAATRGWVARTERDAWVLARDASQIQVADVYRAFVYDADAVGVPQDHLGLSLRDFMRRDRNEEKHEEAAMLSPP
ncbi:MAG: YihY family inner membrane protein [Betaproteobacteria bacterium]|nr:MAG: YihY family inner membrane protein [Betaproteobacteria bacterium]